MPASLRRKLSTSFAALAILPLMLAGTALTFAAFRLQERQSLSVQHQVGRGIISDFRNYLGTLAQELEIPVRQHGLNRLTPEARQTLINGLLSFEPMFVEVDVLDAGGKVLARASRYQAQTGSALNGLGHLPEVSAALLSRTTALGLVRYDEATNEPVIGLAVPSMTPATGEVEGLLVAQARFRRVWEMTAPQSGLSHLSAYVLDNRGQVIAHRNPSVVLANSRLAPVPPDGFVRGLSGRPAFLTSEAMVIGGRRFVVVVEQSLESALRMPLGAVAIVGMVLLFAGLGAALMVVQSRRMILAPLNRLGEAVRAVEAGDLGRRAPVISHDEIGALAASFNSMTDRVEMLLTDLRESEEKFRLVAESTGDAMVVIDENGIIVSWNQGATRMFGYSHPEAIGRSLDLLMPDHMTGLHESILTAIKESGSKGVRSDPREQPAQRKDGSLFPVEVSLATFVFQGRRFFSGIIRDITARKEAESNIRFLARHDALTGLANRPALHQTLDAALTSMTAGSRVCLLFIDLDNFKLVNDSLGHSFGDRLLRMVADRLRAIEGAHNTVCRHGGDEFILVAPGIVAKGEAVDLAKQVLSIMSEPFAIENHAVEVGCSIGITLAPDDGQDAETLIRKADIAMYKAKERGRLNYQVFTAAMDQQLIERRHLEEKLRRAIKADEIVIHLQPKFAFASGLVIGFEALARWNSAEFGMVSPARFIPVAEEAGLIGAIGRSVLRQTLHTLRTWQAEGWQMVPVAVNLSAVQLRDPGLVGDIEALLCEYAIPAELLELELTESMLMGDVEDVRAILVRLRGLGIKLSIDDFGTGYSSLSYLKSFPLNILKIDRSFVVDLPDDHGAAAICLAIIRMAKALSLDVVAEGVETEAQADFLHLHGCDFAQGYLFGHPVAVATAVGHLRTGCEPNPASAEK